MPVLLVTALLFFECGLVIRGSAVRVLHDLSAPGPPRSLPAVQPNFPGFGTLGTATFGLVASLLVVCQLLAVFRGHTLSAECVRAVLTGLSFCGLSCVGGQVLLFVGGVGHDDGDWDLVQDGLIPWAVIGSWVLIAGGMWGWLGAPGSAALTPRPAPDPSPDNPAPAHPPAARAPE